MRGDIADTWLYANTVLAMDTGQVIHDPNALVWRAFAGVEATWP